MFETNPFPAAHEDLIHDVKYDFHGKRKATCSSDHSVKIWDRDEKGQWHCSATWKAHCGSVWRVTWCHPEYGQVIATCSFDRTAAVWEELIGEHARQNKQSHWVKRTSLVDSRTSVTDVKFAPRHLGLLLATCSADCVVRIYEAHDVMNLSQWSLQHEIQCSLSCSCLAWNPSLSRSHFPMICVGSDNPSPTAGGKVQIYEYSDSNRKWRKVEILSIVTDPVHDLEFAPNLGRSYHLLAVASKDLNLFSIRPLSLKESASANISKFDVQRLGEFTEHKSQVWRISWNVFGTILTSSGDDGCVRLWKANYMGIWKCIQVLEDGSRKTLPSIETKTVPVISNNSVRLPVTPPPPPGVMNIKRNSGWPLFATNADKGKLYY